MEYWLDGHALAGRQKQDARPSHRGASRLSTIRLRHAAATLRRYLILRSTLTQLVTPEPPTLNVTPTCGVFFPGATPIGSPSSCL